MTEIFSEIVRFTRDEIQINLDEIEAYGLDEIKSVFYPCKARFHHKVISSASPDLSRRKTDLVEKSTDKVDAFFWRRRRDFSSSLL